MNECRKISTEIATEANEKWVKSIFLIVMIITLIMAGGFYEYVSAIVTIVFTVVIGILLIRKKRIVYNSLYEILSIATIGIFYLMTSLWAVDSGMALIGAVKFYPVILTVIIVGFLGEKKEWIIEKIPDVALCLIIVAVICSKIERLKDFVLVNHRLAGTFQYPNTFAMFLLISLVITLTGTRKNYLKLLYAYILLFGIWSSGSRAVLVLCGATMVVMLIVCKESRKIVGIVVISVMVLGILYSIVCGIPTRILQITVTSSSFLGRLLYAKDAGAYFMKSPFGLGYYGYYYMEPEIQTGVYSVLHVHNDFLQLMLDVGVIPGVVFIMMLGRAIGYKRQPVGNRIILCIMCCHFLFDYDLQFLSMWMLMSMFLPVGNKKEILVPKWKLGIITILGITMLGSIVLGTANFLYYQGNAEKAVVIYPWYTQAIMQQLQSTESVEEVEMYCDKLLQYNQHIPAVYGSLATVQLARGDMNSFIKYKTKEIRMAPFCYKAYQEYFDYLAKGCEAYYASQDYESVSICMKRMEQLRDYYVMAAEKASSLAWKINDQPYKEMPEAEVKYIEMCKDKYFE